MDKIDPNMIIVFLVTLAVCWYLCKCSSAKTTEGFKVEECANLEAAPSPEALKCHLLNNKAKLDALHKFNVRRMKVAHVRRHLVAVQKALDSNDTPSVKQAAMKKALGNIKQKKIKKADKDKLDALKAKVAELQGADVDKIKAIRGEIRSKLSELIAAKEAELDNDIELVEASE